MQKLKEFLKATWSGEGKKPESGITEYGAGTDNPTIPKGVLRQRNNPESNWEFEYVNSGSSSLSHEILSTPVWFYTDSSGKLYHAETESQVPDDAENVKKSTYADVIKHGETTTRAGGNSTPSLMEKYQKDKASKKLLKTIEKLRNTGVDVIPTKRGIRSSFDLKKNPSGEMSVLPLYLFAVKTGNSFLAEKLEGWAEKSGALGLSASDLFADDDFMFEQMRNVSPSELINPILEAQSWREVNSVIAGMYADVAEKFAEPETPTQPAVVSERPLPEKLVEPTPETTEPPKKVVYSNADIKLKPEVLKNPGSTPFSKKFSTEDIDKGMSYLKNVPETMIQAAVLSLTPDDLYAISLVAPNFIRSKEDVDGHKYYSLVPPSARSFYAPENRFISTGGDKSQPIFEIAALALMKLESYFEEFKPELAISSSAGDYSPVFSTGFPFMSELGSQTQFALPVIQNSFRSSLITLMKAHDEAAVEQGLPTKYKELLDDNDPFHILNLKDFELKDPIINEALQLMWTDKERLDEEGKVVESPLAALLKTLSDKTALSEEEIIHKLKGIFHKNITSFDFLRESEDQSSGTYNYSSSKSMTTGYVGRVIGQLVSAQASGSSEDKSLKSGRGYMYAAQQQFTEVMSRIVGEKLDLGMGDTLTYTTSDGRQLKFSMGMMQYLHKFLPYWMNKGEMYAEVNGEVYNIDKLPEEERSKVMDSLVEDIANKCSAKDGRPILDSQDAIKNVLVKYHEGLLTTRRTASQAVGQFGERRSIEKLKPSDDIHSDIKPASEASSALINFTYDGIEDVIKSKDLDTEEKRRKVNSMILEKQQLASLQMREICESFGVPFEYHSTFSQMIDETFESVRDDLNKKVKGDKVSLNILGTAAEIFQMLIPVSSVLQNYANTGEVVSFDTSPSGNYYREKIPEEEIAGSKSPEVLGNVFPSELVLNGYSYTVGGKKGYVLKEERSSGGIDFFHLEDPTGKAVTHQFEGKNNKVTKEGKYDVQSPHLSLVSPFLRSILKLTKDSESVRVGKVRTVNTYYNMENVGSSPIPSDDARAKGRYSYPEYGIPRISSSINLLQLEKSWSALDGAGLCSIRVQ